MNKKLSIEEVISEIEDKWMDIDGVEGVGQGKEDDKDCILVLVSLKTPEIERTVPQKYKSFPVKIVESGVISAQKIKTEIDE